ncbi:MAG TPA: hypothetical protein VF111_13115 [Thermoanaerobaculia bacterium]
MIHRRLIVVLALVCVTCKQAPQKPAQSAAGGGPQVRATVVTVRTVITPADRTFTQTLVIANDRARFTGEQDTWRLYDLKGRRVTFVDDVAKTHRTASLSELSKSRQATLATALPPHYPRVTLRPTDETKPLLGVNAKQTVIDLGGYKRQLWIGDHPAIPDELFSMMQVSDPPSSPLAPMMRTADAALASVRGFPLLDRSEVTYGKTQHIVERTVLSVVQKDVPAALLEIPRDYDDRTPKPAAAAGKKK